jgi:type IV secretory pathway ATPase VirB11/archaellum biosynthesis ATPase
MRITGQTLNQLKPLLTKALEEGAEVSFMYHNKRRNGPLTDFGWGPQGPFITITHKKYSLGLQDQNELLENGSTKPGYQTEIKSFSLAKMSELRVEQFVETE